MAEVSQYQEVNDKTRAFQLLQKYTDCAEYLIKKCRSLQHITGVPKLERKCLAELRYLKSLPRRRDGFDISHLRSSNLSHYLGVVHATEHLPDVIQVLQAFHCPGRSDALHVDVVAGQGQLWVKVVARKAQALHFIWAGRGQYGEKDIVFQAQDFLLCSREHPINFETPELVFAFYNSVTKPMTGHLRELGISVVGNESDVSQDVSDKLVDVDVDMDQSSADGNTVLHGSSSFNEVGNTFDTCGVLSRELSELSPFDGTTSEDTEVESDSSAMRPNTYYSDRTSVDTCYTSQDETVQLASEIREFIFHELLVKPIPDYGRIIGAFNLRPKNSIYAIDNVNLDVTSLITLVSNVTNGSCNFQFKETVLSTQAEEERTKPVKPELDAFLAGKNLFACETAISSFKSILEILGGENERQRAASLLTRLTVVADRPSFRTSTLMNTGKIKDRSKVVFGTGDSLKAVTVTANSGYVRAAEHQGVMYSVYTHVSRALTEQKEMSASLLDP